VDPATQATDERTGAKPSTSRWAESEQIAEVVARIKGRRLRYFPSSSRPPSESGQTGASPAATKTSLVSTLSTNPELKVSDQDLKFLKSLRIKIHEEEEEVE